MIHISLVKDIPSVQKMDGTSARELMTVSTDSRFCDEGEMFVALNGPNHRGIQFVEQVLNKKCSAIVLEAVTSQEKRLLNQWTKTYPEILFVQVSDSLLFYQQLALAHLKSWKNLGPERKVIGITGSNGKTTTKEMVTHLIQAVFPGKVLGTEKNFNNHIGVPRTLLRLTHDVECLIVEMGMNHQGELKILCDMSFPTAGIITNIGFAHIEFFSSQEGIFEEKRTLFDAVMENTNSQGVFSLFGGDPFLKKLPRHPNVITWGGDQSEWSYFYDSKNHTAEIKKGDLVHHIVNSHLVGEHNFKNLINAFLLANTLFPGKSEQFLAVAATFAPKDNRSTWLSKNNKNIYLDAYNANPSSMKAALTGIVDYYKDREISLDRQFFILGDMYELGAQTAEFHQELGLFVRALGISHVAFIGKFSGHYKEGFGEGCLTCGTKEEFAQNHWTTIQERFDYIFIKASRGLSLESLIQ